MSFLRKKERKKERRASFVQYCPLFIMQVMGAPKQPLCGALCTLSLPLSAGVSLPGPCWCLLCNATAKTHAPSMPLRRRRPITEGLLRPLPLPTSPALLNIPA